MKINKIKISGFKSIADVELNDLTPFSVFAGANGAGKSNFFDALKFLSNVVTFGATQALRQFNGYDNIHCFKHRKNKARTFSAEFGYKFENMPEDYCLRMSDMDNLPKLKESFWRGTREAFLKDRVSYLISRRPEKTPFEFECELRANS